jgi:nucleotide-binding universal stress UspA family protein
LAVTKPILVGYDPQRLDYAPVEFGVAMARLTGAPLVVVSIQLGVPSIPVTGEPLQYAVGQPEEDLVVDCSPAVEQVEVELRALGVPVECRAIKERSAAKGLHEAAEDAGLLVVGSSRRAGVERVLAGASTAERLLSGSPCPVALVPKSWRRDTRPCVIGVGYVHSEEARLALRGAHALARHIGATLRVLTAVKESEHRESVEQEVRAVVASLDGVPADTEVLVGDPSEVLVKASEQLDLLVLGSRAYGPLRSVLLGSVSRRVTAGAHCPVIVVPRGVKASLEDILATAPAPTARAVSP